MNSISIDDAIIVHEYLANHYEGTEDPISPRGIKNRGLFESAIHRPFMTIGGKDAYKTPLDKSAALFHGIISNHCFHNGNKRTALLLTMCFLDLNGIWIDKCSDEELFEFTRKVAAHEITERRENEVKEIRNFLKKNSRKTIQSNKQLSFMELRHLLDLAGFDIKINENYAEIYRKSDNRFFTKIILKGRAGTENYDAPYIKKLRKILSLTATHGWDSVRFYQNGYGLTDKIGELLKLRGQVMDWLAKI
ncbi:type II toxin-antitoxin system death-on-curing family toxin [Actinobacillus equuli subsp. haemolyticus]|uniref:type II toxin-antitoxin system death-on-curing family toxin n=1 Tax=Actinobacillus equuli TaxID=718 RepID=UPI002442EF0D|nr:type II toxin-antitoxin system death-on-curing family toxin [Actinobacillus equuli]WGE70655.1 type II toxin-antitoxin system death-on-curing family toxin [Actinobacillus equuli subsp. haemolyticus]